MKLFCGINEFTHSLEKMLSLVQDRYILKKGLNPEEITHLKEFRNFLVCILKNIKENNVTSYEKLISELNNLELSFFKDCKINIEIMKQIINYLGLLLDTIQLLKESTKRYEKIKNLLEESLKRTGHDFILEDVEKEKLQLILEEIRNTTALLIMLEIMMRIEGSKINPIANLRKSMGDRYPEEYFSNLMAGWLSEIYFKNKILKLPLQRIGIDQNYNLFLARPKNMGSADFSYKEEKIELQRVSIDKFKANKNDNFYEIETPLKLHKIINSNMIVLWIGGLREAFNTKCNNKGTFYLIKLNPILRLLTIKINKNVLPVPKPSKNSDAIYKEIFTKIEIITQNLNNIRNILSPKKDGNPEWSFLNLVACLNKDNKVEKVEFIKKIILDTQFIITTIICLKEKLKSTNSTKEKREILSKHFDVIKKLEIKTKFLLDLLKCNKFDDIEENMYFIDKNGTEKIRIKTKKPEFYCSDTINQILT